MLRNLIASTLIITTTSVSLVSPAHAGVIGTETALAPDRQAVLRVLARPDVRAALEAHGVDPEDAKTRIAALSDAEIAELAAQIDNAPAGAGGNLGAVFLLPIFAVMGAAKLIEFTFKLIGLAFRGVAYAVSR